jgi:hypothetical protein
MPVIRTGSFVLYGFTLSDHGALLDGDTAYGAGGPSNQWSWQNFNTIFIIPYPTTVVFFGPTLLDTTTEGNGWPAGAPPPGFNVHSGFIGPSIHGMIAMNCPGTPFGLNGTNEGIGLTGLCGAASTQNTDPLLIYLELLTFYKAILTGTPGLVAGGISKTGPYGVGFPTPSGLRVEGGYDIIAWWWKLPDVTPCGDRNTNGPNDSQSHLVLAEEQPPTPVDAFGEFEKLDPNDSDAAPTPIIKTLVPAGGRRGTRVQIIGEGFGDDANVQFDGVDADDIDVVSQYQILCTAPSHATGYANVRVINVDGVSS